MDKLYIGDINKQNHYISFDKNGIILLFSNPYNKPVDTELTVYRIFPLQNGKFIYNTYTSDINTLLTRDIYDIQVSNKWYDRGDALTILSFFCCIAVATLWLTNLFTSVFKKGGILSGLF